MADEQQAALHGMRLVDTCYGMTGGDLYACGKCNSRVVVRQSAPVPSCPTVGIEPHAIAGVRTSPPIVEGTGVETSHCCEAGDVGHKGNCRTSRDEARDGLTTERAVYLETLCKLQGNPQWWEVAKYLRAYAALSPAQRPPLDDSPVCAFSGKPNRGDCLHFIGLPATFDETTTDVYGRPNGWCWWCWRSYQLEAAQDELFRLCGPVCPHDQKRAIEHTNGSALHDIEGRNRRYAVWPDGAQWLANRGAK